MQNRLIIGTRVDATSYEDACDRIETWITENLSCYVVAANVHVVMMGHWHSSYQDIINQAQLVTPDGMPLVWGLRWLGIRDQSRVYGPDLMLAWCERASANQIPLFLYGGSSNVLETLQSKLTQRFPDLKIVGTYSPPFRPLTPAEEASDRAMIEQSGAKVVLVGLGCPKQEQWMARQQGQLAAVMIGVGAAFNFHSGNVSQAPRWMMQWGLEWLYRLVTEPKRLWRRYFINNPSFIILFGWQLLRQWGQRPRKD